MQTSNTPRVIVLPECIKNIPVGLGLRHPYYEDILNHTDTIKWLEVHPENYFGGGVNRKHLETIRQDFELSFHAVGLSLGSNDGIDTEHLQKIKELIDIFEPFQFSDHVSWSASGNAHLNDLLPLPYTQETLEKVCDNINFVQDTLETQILVENPSTYISFVENDMPEYDFMNAISEKTGCKMIMDVNNIYVQSHNHGHDPYAYIDAIKSDAIGEIHLGGYSAHTTSQNEVILIDTHSKPVHDPVWKLYAHTIKEKGIKPTLIEWDEELPPLETLLQEAQRANDFILETLS